MQIVACCILLLLGCPLQAQHKVYLTFDDGPSGGSSDVLDVLKDLKTPATFFVTGGNQIAAGGAATQKALADRMQKEGHLLGNHCFSHKPATVAEYEAAYGDLKTPAQKAAFAENFAKNKKHFADLLGQPQFKFVWARLPGDGRTLPHLVAETKALKLKHLSWDYEFAPNGTLSHIAEKDWQGIAGVACTYKTIPPKENVVLLHDAHWKGKGTLLKKLIEKLKAEGCTFAQP